jgi:hypothetical protein
MQAHSQSIPAARIPLAASVTSGNPSGLDSSLSQPVLPSATHHEATTGAGQAGLAHDAGNLLGALGLYCDLLRKPGVLRPEHVHYATELSLISSRSSALIRRLMETSPAPGTLQVPQSVYADASADVQTPHLLGPANPRLATPHKPLEFQPSAVRRRDCEQIESFRPGFVYAKVLQNLAPVLERIAAGSAKVRVSAPATLPPLDLTVETLERITVNLVRNAAEAIRLQHAGPRPAGGCFLPGLISVELTVSSDSLQLTVEDNGPGLHPAVAAAFIRPTPLPPGSRNGHGHRIVHELLAASHGQISIRVRPGRGTAFRLKWPLPSQESLGPSLIAGSSPIAFKEVSEC